MFEALSLRTGRIVDARKVGYESYRNLLPLCPQCGEPVHLRRRERPYLTPYFAHHKEVAVRRLIRQCPLRTAGQELSRASTVIRGLRHGQFVDRFQSECCLELHKIFARYANKLIGFIEESNFVPLDERDYREFIGALSGGVDPQRLLDGLGVSGQVRAIDLGFEDVDLFLRSDYGEAVGNFIFQCAYFVAMILHPDAIDRDLGRTYFDVGKRRGIFPYEPWRLRTWQALATEVLLDKDPRNRLLPRIAATLVTLVLMRWRGPRIGIELLICADEISLAKHVQLQKRNPSRDEALNKSNLGRPMSSPVVDSHPKFAFKPLGSPTRLGPPATLLELSGPKWYSPIIIDQTPPKRPDQYGNTEPPTNIKGSNIPTPVRSKNIEISKNPLKPDFKSNVPLTSNITQKKVSISTFESLESKAGDNDIYKVDISHIYDLNSIDKNRILALIYRSRDLKIPSRKMEKSELMEWANTKNPIEAYFLAGFLGAKHEPHNFSDPTLATRLNRWLEWARKTTNKPSL